MCLNKMFVTKGGPAPCPSPPTAAGKVGPWVMSVGELIQSLTSCSAWESRSCTSPGQHNRADPVDWSTGDLTIECALGNPALPFNYHMDKRALSCHPTLTACAWWESWPCLSPAAALGRVEWTQLLTQTAQ